jgi:maltose alpha-D-glucosyltransferase/alpha-amylase
LGRLQVIATRDPAVLIIRYDWRNNSVLLVHNLDERPREITFSTGLSDGAGKPLVNLLSEDHSQANEAPANTRSSLNPMHTAGTA